MKTQNIIRVLAGLSFLIFFCPFFQTCSDRSLLKQQRQSILADTATQAERVAHEAKEKKWQQESLEESRDKATLNGYGMGYYVFQSADEFETKDLLDLILYGLFAFTVSILLSVWIAIASFTNKNSLITKLCYWNLALVVGSMPVFYLKGVLEDINQIKFGYYLFVINTIAIIVFCKKALKQNAI